MRRIDKDKESIVIDKKVATLCNQIKNQYKTEIKLCNILMSNDWRYTVRITGTFPSVLVKNLREHLNANGFKTSTYAYLLIPKEKSVVGYIATILPDDEAQERFYNTLLSMPNIEVKPVDNRPFPLDRLIEYMQESKEARKFYISRNVKRKQFAEKMIDATMNDYAEEYKKKHATIYPENYNLRGSINKKEVTFFPRLNRNKDGYILTSIKEYDIKGQLKYSLYLLSYFQNGQHVKNAYFPIAGKAPFVYVIFEKSTGNIVYIGQTRHIDSRIQRHFNPKEGTSYEAFLTGEMYDNSVVKAYAFYKQYGILEKTETNFNKFRNFKTPWNNFIVRFLPLSAYTVQYKDIVNQATSDLMELAEAYVMHTLEQEAPDKIIRADENMRFFNREIKAFNVPLYHTADAYNNSSKISVNKMLNRYSDIVKSSQFKSKLLESLSVIRLKSFNNLSLYETILHYGLTFEEATRYAVGLDITPKEHFYNAKTGQYLVEYECDAIECTKDIVDKYEQGEKIVAHILKSANYKGENEYVTGTNQTDYNATPGSK